MKLQGVPGLTAKVNQTMSSKHSLGIGVAGKGVSLGGMTSLETKASSSGPKYTDARNVFNTLRYRQWKRSGDCLASYKWYPETFIDLHSKTVTTGSTIVPATTRGNYCRYVEKGLSFIKYRGSNFSYNIGIAKQINVSAQASFSSNTTITWSATTGGRSLCGNEYKKYWLNSAWAWAQY